MFERLHPSSWRQKTHIYIYIYFDFHLFIFFKCDLCGVSSAFSCSQNRPKHPEDTLRAHRTSNRCIAAQCDDPPICQKNVFFGTIAHRIQRDATTWKQWELHPVETRMTPYSAKMLWLEFGTSGGVRQLQGGYVQIAGRGSSASFSTGCLGFDPLFGCCPWTMTRMRLRIVAFKIPLDWVTMSEFLVLNGPWSLGICYNPTASGDYNTQGRESDKRRTGWIFQKYFPDRRFSMALLHLLIVLVLFLVCKATTQLLAAGWASPPTEQYVFFLGMFCRHS